MTALGSWIELGTITKKSKTLRTYIIIIIIMMMMMMMMMHFSNVALLQ